MWLFIPFYREWIEVSFSFAFWAVSYKIINELSNLACIQAAIVSEKK